MTAGPPDLVLWPVLNTLRNELARQLGIIRRPVCQLPIYTGGTPMPADEKCDCTCENLIDPSGQPVTGQGAGWVRFVNATTTVPGQTTTRAQQGGAPCWGEQLNVTLELGVYRCAPMLDLTVEKPAAPTPEEYEDHSRGRLQDALAIHRAVMCSAKLEKAGLRWNMPQLGPAGPDGGCDAMIGTVTVVVDNCCPLVITAQWTPDPDDPLTVSMNVAGYGEQGGVIIWGDLTQPQVINPNTPPRHTYPAAGTYDVIVFDRAVPDAKLELTVTVDDAPTAHVFVDAADPWQAILWIDEPYVEGVAYEVDWGDGFAESVPGQRGADPQVPVSPRAAHEYHNPGLYTVTVTDPRTRRATELQVDLGDLGLALRAGEPDAPTLVVWSAFAGAELHVDLGDGEAPHTVLVDEHGGAELALPSMAAGSHDVRVTELVDGVTRRSSVCEVRIPYVPADQLAVDVTWVRPLDEPERVIVTVEAPDSDVACQVDWGDDTGTETLDPGEQLDHVYTLPLQPLSTWLNVYESTVDGDREYSRLLGEPRYIGTPTLVSTEDGMVQLAIAGQDPGGADRYHIDWADGHVDIVSALGRWTPARHTYAVPGVYEITVDAPGMPAPVSRQVTVASYPTAPVG